MKKLAFACIFLISIFTFHFSSAQDITPNSGLEMWTLVTSPTQYLNPDSWDQLNDETNFIGILTCVQSTDAHSGNFAAKLITKYVDLGIIKDTANGIITTGKLITVPPYGNYGGVPSHERPDSIYGWIKYQPVAPDSCQIEIDLRTAAGDTVGKAKFQTGLTLTTYTRFSAPVIYKSSENPDTIMWLISSSNGFKAIPNSTLWVDDIGVVMNTGINEISLGDFITITPNPSSKMIQIKNDKMISGDLIFYDGTGKLTWQHPIKNQNENLDVSDIPEGIYLAQLIDDRKKLVASGKIIIQR